MDQKEVIALVRSDIKKHEQGKLDRMPTISQYAKQAHITIGVLESLILKLSEKEQAYCYNHESNDED
jgi:hypothetical protein